ncbi:hypothetical protein [Caldimonas brevitalea]|uniref:hypothetical protein n=1 Tax=Caldimonas brevitalea TaxID=413882 RepID=UPI0012FB4DBE|nr:hypothetical protein [Caldimonas brevitalea]
MSACCLGLAVTLGLLACAGPAAAEPAPPSSLEVPQATLPDVAAEADAATEVTLAAAELSVPAAASEAEATAAVQAAPPDGLDPASSAPPPTPQATPSDGRLRNALQTAWMQRRLHRFHLTLDTPTPQLRPPPEGDVHAGFRAMAAIASRQDLAGAPGGLGYGPPQSPDLGLEWSPSPASRFGISRGGLRLKFDANTSLSLRLKRSSVGAYWRARF